MDLTSLVPRPLPPEEFFGGGGGVVGTRLGSNNKLFDSSGTNIRKFEGSFIHQWFKVCVLISKQEAPQQDFLLEAMLLAHSAKGTCLLWRYKQVTSRTTSCTVGFLINFQGIRQGMFERGISPFGPTTTTQCNMV